MSERSRFQRTLYYESQITGLASQVGPEQATDEAKVMLDGACNALTRLKGPRVSAEFAMQLGDRVIGNFDVTNLGKSVEETKEVEGKKAEEKPKRAAVVDLQSSAWLFFFGFAIGLTARFL